MNRFSFVLVHVTYDYHRFQNNIGAATGIREARKLAKEINPNLTVIESEKESDALDANEVEHLFIQKLPNNKVPK